MPRLTPESWRRLEKVFLSVGCHFVRETGDHRMYDRSELVRPIVIRKKGEVPIFEIKNNIRSLGISTKEFLKLLGR